jgi:hypothetical protein
VRTQALRSRYTAASTVSWGGEDAPKERRTAQGAQGGIVERTERLHDHRNLLGRRREC